MNTDCAEMVPINQSGFKRCNTYFMPHKPVFREDKVTTKLRVVFDASAHYPGLPSLNQLLLPGENLVPNLLKIFLNSRIKKVGLTADTEKAFLQIDLQEKHRNSHSFLWYK